MKKQNKILYTAIIFLSLFIVWTVLLKFVDLKPIGPDNSTVGLATINGNFHSLTGVNMALYTITDWLGLIPIFICLCFGLIGLLQIIKSKSLLKVGNKLPSRAYKRVFGSVLPILNHIAYNVRNANRHNAI